MRNVTFGQRLRYAFDNTLSKGTIALIGWLALVSAIAILIIAGIVFIFGWASDQASAPDFGKLVWMGLMRTLDSGTMGGDEGNLPFLFSMLAVTLVGIFIISTLIGVLTTGIEGTIDELRKGRSQVIEENHTLILGWSEEIFTVLSELSAANTNQKKPRIVVLAEKDKVEMEDEIRAKVGDTGRTRIICRSGSVIDPVDLDIVNPQGARSIIILAPEDEDPDSQVIKTMLAITNSPKRRAEPYHIVAEIRERKNMEVARLVGGAEAQLIEAGDTIARVIVQTCRQTGLSVVYTELLDFGGDEIYFKEEPALVGKPFSASLLSYEDSTIIGLVSPNGTVELSPPEGRMIDPGDRLIAISADDDTIKIGMPAGVQIDEAAIRTHVPAPPAPEKTLILGWNRRAPMIINELNNYVAPGSSVTVIADHPEAEAVIAELSDALTNQTVEFHIGDTNDRRVLDSLAVQDYQHVIVLCYSDSLDTQRADARTLITLLHLRDIENKLGEKFSVVSEMMDDRNRELAEVTKADDFIVSDKLISLMLAQVSENKHLNAVFTDLFDPEGVEIYLKPAENYVATGKPVNFYTVVEAARRRGEIAIGHSLRSQSADASKSFGVAVNPAKSKTATYAPGDRIIVLADQ